MEDVYSDYTSDDDQNNELDYIPDLTPIQEKQIEELPDILDKIDMLLKILNIPDNLEPDNSHMEPFEREDKVRHLYENIIEDCQTSGILNSLTSFDLLYFLYPDHNPPF